MGRLGFHHRSEPGAGAAILLLLGALLLGGAGPAAGQPSQSRGQPDLGTTSELPGDFLLGLEASMAISQHFGLVETDSLMQRINDIGYAVALAAGRPEILFTFQILNMDEPNAMALPGGWIFITRGLMELGLTDAELAHLFGHEITHVTHAHFSRQGRLDGLLSLLQTAVMVAVVMTGTGSSSSRPVIEDPGGYGYPQSSSEAALTGTAVFGSVFHELLLRGYGRKLEMEADDGGRRLAALAGYPREAGASLLSKLHDRIYEEREYGYWHTHPYFTDRVAAARSVGAGADYSASRNEVQMYRQGVQAELARAATTFRSEELGNYLYELALRAGPADASNVAVHLQLLEFRKKRMDRKDPLLRRYGPLVADYDSLLADAHRTKADSVLTERVAAVRDSLEQRRQEVLPRYLDAVNGPNSSTQIMELFLRNFPEHEIADVTRLRVARSYRLSGRFDLAAEKLGDLLAHTPAPTAGIDSTDIARARVEIFRSLPKVEDPEVCQKIYDKVSDPEIREAARLRLEVIADSLTSLEKVGRFVQGHPRSPSVERFRKRLETLAETEFKQGRLHEALGDEQSALGVYNRVAILAPHTPSSEEARRGITRIQSLAATGTAK
jgi:Zn-dependent protease with chaperone function